MSLETEVVLDRRRLKRSTALWRALAILAIAVALGAVLLAGRASLGITQPKQIARVTIEGMITEDRAQLRMLKRIADAKQVAGVILAVNSPGGTTTGGEALFEALRDLAAKKPIVAQFGTVAASAAYIAGLGTDHIVARGNSITGSVGVIVQWPEFTELMNKLGVKMHEIKSGPLKATPSPFQPLDEGGRKVTEQMIVEGQQWFLNLVRSRRGVATDKIPGLEQGSIYSGREALKHKLVDQLGGEAEAVRWLEEERKVGKNLRIVDWKPRRDTGWPLSSVVSQIAEGGPVAFMRQLVGATLDGAGLGALRLDGLVSVWQPAKN
jgi:protease IV